MGTSATVVEVTVDGCVYANPTLVSVTEDQKMGYSYFLFNNAVVRDDTTGKKYTFEYRQDWPDAIYPEDRVFMTKSERGRVAPPWVWSVAVRALVRDLIEVKDDAA